MATRIKLRRDTAANWTSANPILALGEPGLETDTRKVKYGDGSTAWNSLQYAAGGTAGTGTDYTLPVATGSVLGGIKVGARLTITDGVLSADVQAGGTGTTYVLPTATGSVLGGIKIGSGLAIDGSGVVSVTGGSDYTLPIASGSVLGGVKVGGGLAVDGSGVLSNTVTTGNLSFAFTTITANNSNFQLNSVGGNIVLAPTGVVSVGTGSGTIIFNGNSGNIQMPTGGQIFGASGATYNLRDVSTIYFSDGTTQTSASIAGDISSLVNGAQEISLSSTGTTTFPGEIQLPQVDVSVEYENVEALSVNSSTVVLAGGAYPFPEAGWLYNGIEIQSVIPLSGNYSIVLVSPFGSAPGFYTLTSFPNSVLTAIVFSDGSRQTTAYTGTNVPMYVTATIDLSQVDQDIVPDATGVRNLGSNADKWRTIYLSSSTFYVGTSTVTVSGTNLLINGTAITGSGTGTSVDIENSWTPPDATSWQIKTYTGNFSGTYEQDITGLTYTCAPANTGTETFILINRNDWTQIDTVLATVDELRLDGTPVGIVSIIYDTYPDGVRINVNQPVTISSATEVVVEYRTLGSGPLVWFDFADTPNAGVGLIGGEINFHTHVRLNDGLDGIGGDVVTLTFNTASGDFDQSKLSHGAASSSTFTVFNSSSTGIAYQTNWGAGQLDQIKVQWSAKLYYNGSWFAES